MATSPLRAVYDDGKRHSEGRVKGMWSSGIVLETDVHPSIGSPVALVVLSGGFDGDKLSAQVAGFEKNALLLDLPGLDPVRWARLQALVDGKPVAPTVPPISATNPKPPPPNAPVFIISGGEDADGAPTGVFNVSDAGVTNAAAAPPPPAVMKSPPPTSPFSIPTPLDPFPFAPAAVPTTSTASSSRPVSDAELQAQKRTQVLAEENARLKNEVTRLSGLNAALQDELKAALAKLDAIERMMKR